MRYPQPLETGTLVRRYKRFFADVLTDGGEPLCIHCPNTGSMLNCMGEGARVWFFPAITMRVASCRAPGSWCRRHMVAWLA